MVINKNDYKFPGVLDSDLIGLSVYDKSKYKGKIVGIEKSTLYSLLVVDGVKRHLIPNIEKFIKDIDLDSKKIYIIQSNFMSEDEVSNEIVGVTVSRKKAEEIFNGEINKIKCDYDFNSLDVKDSTKTSNLEEEQWYFDKTDDSFNLFLNGRYNTNSCSVTIKEYDLEKVLELDKNNKGREER